MESRKERLKEGSWVGESEIGKAEGAMESGEERLKDGSRAGESGVRIKKLGALQPKAIWICDEEENAPTFRPARIPDGILVRVPKDPAADADVARSSEERSWTVVDADAEPTALPFIENFVFDRWMSDEDVAQALELNYTGALRGRTSDVPGRLSVDLMGLCLEPKGAEGGNTIARQSQPARKLSTKLDYLHKKLAVHSTSVYFLTRCRDLSLTPKGLRLNFNVSTRQEEKWKIKCESELLKIRLQYNKARFYQIKEGIEQTKVRLGSLLPTDIFDRLESCCMDSYHRAHCMETETKKRKFLNLTMEKTWVFRSRVRHHRQAAYPNHSQLKSIPDPPDKVSNLSQQGLTTFERAFLDLGPKFGIAGRPTPLAHIAARVELAAQTLANKGKKVESEQFRGNAIKMVTKIPAKPKPNLTSEQRTGLLSLRKDKNRICLRADKSETVVVLDRADYDRKLEDQLNTPDYKLLERTGRRTDGNPYPAAADRFIRKLKAVFVTSYPIEDAEEDPSRSHDPESLDPLDPGDAEAEPRGPQARLKQANRQRYFEYRSVYKSHGTASPAYALPKTHKLGRQPGNEKERQEYVGELKLRMIAPAYTSVDFLLCKHLSSILGALPRPTHAPNSLEESIRQIQGFRPGPSTILVSFDAVAMYPSIDVGRSCAAVQKRLESFEDLPEHTTLSPADIASLLEWCFCNTYLQIGEDRWYQQKRGLAIGKSISSVVAELFMQELEKRINEEAEYKWGFYLRWVDDSLASWDHGLDLLHEYFMPFLNSLDQSLKFTVEIETDRKINFLDVSIIRQGTWLETSVFRKASNTQHFIPETSNHPWAQKIAAMRHAVRRAYVYCNTPAGLQDELNRIHIIFARNGYSFYTITDVAQKVKSQVRTEALAAVALRSPAKADLSLVRPQPHNLPIKIGLPYLGPWSLQMQRLGIKYGVYFALSNRQSVLRSFPSPKAPMTSAILGGSVYELCCSCPDGRTSRYIGQSGVPIMKRLEWHQKDWSSGRGSFSAHKAQDGHQVNFQAIRIVAEEPNYPVRVVLEALHILRLSTLGANMIANPNLEARDGRRINKSDGIRLSPMWGPIAKKI